MLNNNRLDKQLARIRLNYVSLSGFLFRHGLSAHNHCEPCFAAHDVLTTQSALHHLLHCPVYDSDRKALFSAVSSALDRSDSHPVSSFDLLHPTGVSKVDFTIADAICAFTTSTMNGFM